MKYILFAISLSFCTGANAAYIVESSPRVVTAIGDIDIDGVLYNVDFEAANNVFSTFGGSELFWSDGASATAAVIAVNSLLQNAAGGTLTRLNNPPVFPPDGHGYIVAAGFNSDVITFYSSSNQAWQPPLVRVGPYDEDDFRGTAWSIAEVPLPAAAWLFFSALGGLVGIGGLQRRR